MPTSEAKIAANRRNALKSTGPKTPEGKERSKANALKHGLTAKVLRTPEEVEILGEPADPPPGKLGTSFFDRAWLEGEIGLLALRIARAGLMENRLRERAALRATLCWDEDRKSEAESIGEAIRRKPASVASKLEASVQGCTWLIERWAILARIAERDGDWGDPERALAFDLLGVPVELRAGRPGEIIDVDGTVLDPGPAFVELARAQSARLMEVQKTLFPIDDFDRQSAEAGLAEDLGAAGARLRKYENALQRRLALYLEKLAECPAELAPPDERPIAPELRKKLDRTAEAPEPSRRELRADRVERRREAAARKLERSLR